MGRSAPCGDYVCPESWVTPARRAVAIGFTRRQRMRWVSVHAACTPRISKSFFQPVQVTGLLRSRYHFIFKIITFIRASLVGQTL